MFQTSSQSCRVSCLNGLDAVKYFAEIEQIPCTIVMSFFTNVTRNIDEYQFESKSFH